MADSAARKLWKINCMEDRYPGMWQHWYREQCVAVGWHSEWGYHLEGETKGGKGWKRARKALQKISVGDWVIVALRGHRVGRLGEVTKKEVEDGQWDPLVLERPGLKDGEMGRRLHVKWDFKVGPDNRDLVIALPEGKRFTLGELRPTIAEVRSQTFDDLCNVMKAEENWVALFAKFKQERAISNYVATYPHRLEDGLTRYPDAKGREKVFADGTRADVLLLDRHEVPVVVECKQHQPTVDNLRQLRAYMSLFETELGKKPRGILLHSGARKLTRDVKAHAAEEPVVEVVHFSVEVDFRASV